jgi:2,4-diaminopentanoate dehydrogenase
VTRSSAPLSVIQYGTGNVGKHALRGIVERSDMELVAVRVYDPTKVGRDAGELIGGQPVGVLCTDSFDEILATDADCVVYNALAETLPGGPQDAVDEICALLSSGKNVCSTAVSHHVYPKVLPTETLEQLERACVQGVSTFFSSGVNPGFAFDIWPITMTHLSRRIDHLVCSEFCDMAHYTSKNIMYFMGFGEAPDFDAPIIQAHSDEYHSAYYASLLMLADALRLDLDDVRFERETAVATAPVVTGAGIVEAGQVAATRLRFTGSVAGVDRLEYRVIWRVSDDVAREWGVGDGVWTIDITGDPAISTRLDVTTQTDSGRAVSITTAMHPLNAVPMVCAAAPGVVSHLDLPLYAGGYVAGTPG